jgi:hypothetical protein
MARTLVDWVVRLQRWPIAVVGEFLGTRTDKDPQARAARRWLRRLLMTQAEQLALFSLLVDKGVIERKEYEAALQRAAQQLCIELEETFPGMKARDDGVSMLMPEAFHTTKDWPA